MKLPTLTRLQRDALRDLAYPGEYPAFPGAIGRPGGPLVRMGLARRVGMTTYEQGRNELPARFMKFEITKLGWRVLKTLPPEWEAP